MTPKEEETLISLQFIYVLAKMIDIEHTTHIDDTSVLNKQMGILAKRIKSDATTVINYLKRVNNISVKDDDHAVDFCCELHEVYKLFACCPKETAIQFLEEVKPKIEA